MPGIAKRVAVIVPGAPAAWVKFCCAFERDERVSRFTGVRIGDAKIVRRPCIRRRERQHTFEVGDRGTKVR